MHTAVDQTDNLFDWFQRRVRDARVQTGVDLSEDSTLYLVQLLSERARSDIDAPSSASIASRAADTSALDGERRMKKPNSRSTIWVVASTLDAFSARSINENTPLPGANSPISTVSPDKGTDPCTVAPL